jgi:hypothetical protein
MADPENTPLPSDAQQQRAKWDLLLADLRYRSRQNFWETPRGIAMLLLAFAAVFAAGGLSNWFWPDKPTVTTVKSEQPLAVKLAR